MAQRKFSTVVKAGNRRETLIALRDLLATRLESASDRDAAALALRLQSVMTELGDQGGAEDGSVDDLAAKRAARRSKAAAK